MLRTPTSLRVALGNCAAFAGDGPATTAATSQKPMRRFRGRGGRLSESALDAPLDDEHADNDAGNEETGVAWRSAKTRANGTLRMLSDELRQRAPEPEGPAQAVSPQGAASRSVLPARQELSVVPQQPRAP